MNWQPINTLPIGAGRVLFRLKGDEEHFSMGSFSNRELKVDLAQYFITADSQCDWLRRNPITHWMRIPKGPENETI